jgi:hypothetical protein
MKRRKITCETCQLRGYSPDFCKLHQKKISEVDAENCHPQDFYKRLGKKAALGAGVGVVAATAGIVAAPAVGLKAVIGHALAAKITAGGGAAGAGINVARGARKNHPGTKRAKKRDVLLPLYLKKRS